jgi:hypothetical protein
MRSRFMKFGVTIAALAALAVGGSAIATAAQKGGAPAPPVPATTTADPVDTPDAAAPNDTVQQGDQSTLDAADPADAPDSSTEASDPSDGPGGHADPAGTVDNQQQGEN